MRFSMTTSFIGHPKVMLRKRFPPDSNKKSWSGRPYPMKKEVLHPPNIGYLGSISSSVCNQKEGKRTCIRNQEEHSLLFHSLHQ